MSITLKKNGKYFARLQLPTGERRDDGSMIYRTIQKTCDSKSEAELWERKQKDSQKLKGSEGHLNASQLAEYHEAKQAANGHDLRDVVKFWRLHHPIGNVLTCREVWEKYESSKAWEDYSDKTQSNKRHGIKKFLEVFGDTPINGVTVEAFEDYLEQFDAVKTRNTNSSTIKTMFSWAAHRKQGYLQINQLKFVEHDVESYKEPSTLTVEQVQNLFDAAVEVAPTTVPFLALEYFAGIRTEEIEKMAKDERQSIDMDAKTIFVRAGVAKGKGKGKEAETARLLENLPKTLWKWLEASDFKGEIDKTNHKDRIRKAYIKAGIKEEGNIKVGQFHSVARHCFASYAYALLQDAGKVRKWTGHSGTDLIFRRHYASLKKQEEGKAYFNILPKGKIEKGIQPNLAGATNNVSDEELLNAYKTMNYSQIARAYGVSPNAIKKRLKKLEK
jgi:site-specific recombinase XerD